MPAAAAPVRRGRKDPALLAPKAVEPEPEYATVLVTARPLRVGDELLPPGVVVPGADYWPRLDAWIGTRFIKRIPATEPHWTYEDWMAQREVEKIEAELAAEADDKSKE